LFYMSCLSYFVRDDHCIDIWRKVIYSPLKLPVVTNRAAMTSLVPPAGVPPETSQMVA
jgi:hypothetical protein